LNVLIFGFVGKIKYDRRHYLTYSRANCNQ